MEQRKRLMRLVVMAAWLLSVLPPSQRALAATFTVTITANSGAGSLRQAMLDANANPGADTIAFAIGAIGSQQTISPTAALPTITDPIVIDGWSQGGAGYASAPLIEINGALAGSSVSGLTIIAGNSTVHGLVINGFVGTFASGIRLQTGGDNWIYGNYIGTDFAGATRVANTRGIWIDGGSSNNRIGTNADGVNDVAERNVISANVEQNIWIYQPATTGNKIMGNYIGLNAAGTAAVGTNNQAVAAAGILVQEASYTVIGTDGDGQGDTQEGNVISGNTLNINVTGTSNLNESHHNRISGNRIGTNASGTASVGIQAEGVRVYVAQDNLIGTDGDGVSDDLEGNLISGHIDFGVMLQQIGAVNTVVAGNKIGTDITGMAAIPNGTISSPRAGILLGGYGNRIGTNSDGVSDELERNLISGNTNVSTYAIYFNNLPNPSAPPTIIAGNWMGVNATGLAALPNNVGIGNTSYAPTIIRDNVISGHTYEGISTQSSDMLITGNRIGVGADGVTPLGNGYHGLFLSGNHNLIGGTGPGEANIIAHNGTVAPYYSGVRVGNTGVGNTIRGNHIYTNSQLGIDLRWPDGVNVNDLDDPDTGGNNLQNFPVITFAQAYTNGTTRIQGTLNSNSNITFTLDFYYNSTTIDSTGYGEGEFYLGETSVTTDANGDATFDVTLPVTIPPNVFVSATATHADGSTSEFSPAYAAGGVLAPFAVTTTADSGAGSLRQAILDANANPGEDTVTFAIGSIGSPQTISLAAALSAITDPIVIDGWSQGGAGYTGPPLIEINGSAIATWNTTDGLQISAGSSTVRGLAINYFNIAINLESAGNNVIAGNYLGLALDGVTPIGNRTGMRIVAASDGNRIGTNGDGINDAAERNIISASGFVQQNNSSGILIDQGSDNNWIAGNFIGTDASGTQDRGNAVNGITTGGITIIGTNGDGVGDAVEGNLISGNNSHGVALASTSSGSRVAGNKIGTDLAGAIAIPNNSNGISVGSCSAGQCSDYIIGTNGDGVSDALEGNLISGNGAGGVFIPAGTLDNNVIAGNKIGTNLSGTAALPNDDYGVHLGGDFSRVGTDNDGTSDDLEGNLISGNGDGAGNDNHGVLIPGGSDHNLVAGNFIGTTADGTAALPNGQTGLRVEDDFNTLTGNLISGNGEHGVHLYDAFFNTVTGNIIGVAIAGTAPLSNALHGVYVSTNSDDNTIGGVTAAQGNVIAFNGGDGVFVDNNCGAGLCLRNAIAGNRIFANNGLGIDLFPNGVTLNDPTDADTGANNLQNFPVITTVDNTSGLLTTTGTLTSTANMTYTLHFYSNAACDVSGYGEGQTYLGAITTTTDLAGFVSFTATLPISAPDGESITATATDSAGNTSEFSACSSPIGYAPISGLQAFNDSPTYLGAPTHFTATVTGGSGITYAWDFGDGLTGNGATLAHAYNSIGTYAAIVTATNSGSSAVASTIVTITQPPACAATFNHGVTLFTSDDASAVQQAIDGANSNDTLKIAGTCTGVATRHGVTQTIYLNKSLTLRGGYSLFDWSTPYPITRPTTFDAQSSGRVIFITNTVPVTLENLIVQNGFISGTAAACPDYGCGGGLYTNGALNLSSVQMLNNTARRAGGAYIAGALNAINTTWQNNQCSAQRGGAFEVYGAATLNGGLLESNRCAYGGGLFANAALTISGTHFISNTATSTGAGSGGAIYSNGSLSILNARFERNTSYTGGGAVLHSGADPLIITGATFISNTALNPAAQGGALNDIGALTIIHDSVFQGNHTPGEGGAIVGYKAMTLTSVSLLDNAAGSQGGAIYHWGLSVSGDTSQVYPLVISDTLMLNNNADEGGALYFRRGFTAANVPVQIDHTSFLSNTAVLSGGAVYLGQPAVIADSTVRDNASLMAMGGGLFAEDALAMTRTTVQGNTAYGAGGAYLKGPLTAIDTMWRNNQCLAQRGGAFEVYGTATLIGGMLEGNQCQYAGGIFADAALTISGTHFISNTASSAFSGSGGAIYSDGALTLINAWFERNASYTGGGAVLHSGTEPLAITATTFISNTTLSASAQGGALYAIGAATTIHDSLFQGNTAPGSSGGGGAIAGAQAMTLSHVTLISNTAGQHGGAIYHWGLSESGNTSQIKPLIISNTNMMNNTANGEGGALYFRRGFAAANTPIQIDHTSFRSNASLLRGGALYLGQPSLIARSEFRDNTSLSAGGGLHAQDNVNVTGVTFVHNTAATDGGALRLSVQPGSTSRVENSIFAYNQAAGHGAGISIISGKSIEIVHSTFAGGSLNARQAIYAAGSAVHITNTIIASHTVGIERGNLATVTAERNLFSGNTLDITGSVTNTNPIAGEPRFIDPASDDYHLSLGSAALDAGLNLNLSTDFEDDLRFIGAGVDVGADEFGDAALIGGGQTIQIGVEPRPGQQVSITIPPGAVGGTGIIRLQPIISPTRPLAPQRPFANLGFMLQTQSGGGLRLAAAETFLTPITIELRYTDADVIGLNEASLDLLMWDEIGQIWITAQASCASPMSPVRQAGSNTLIVSTCAEGEFALAGGPYQLYLPIIRRL